MKTRKTAHDVRRLEDRLSVLSRVLRTFAEATTEYERLLEIIAQTLAEEIKDGCVVRLFSSEAGWLEPVAIHLPFEEYVPDAAAAARVRQHVAARHHISEHGAARKVLETGQALLVPKLDLERLRADVTPDIAVAFETIGIHSLLFVPLRIRRESIGLFSLVRFAPASVPFDERDRELAQALADHAALAIANSRLLKTALHELAERERAEAMLRKTEEQLRHAQKMEAVGRLAGGVAHDFNNLLSVIMVYTDPSNPHLGEDDGLRSDVEEIRRAALSAADLTKQLLAFSRRQVFDVQVVNLNENLSKMENMLRRLLGADIELTTLFANDLGRVRVDGGQIEQVVMNLAVNARDAMPQGGKLTIETANVQLDAEYARAHYDVVPGEYVLLAVTDSGIGMDPETQARIFEPFFTTKQKGTGLGLATSFGIVKQSGGHIWVYSELGKGTTLKIYLPRAEVRIEASQRNELSLESAAGDETILLVEDSDQLRVLARTVLRRHGYTVLDAPNGGEALLICEEHRSPIDLLLTDVVLPRMSGPELAKRLAKLRPEMKVVFMSGYTDDTVLQHGVIDSDAPYLEKPLIAASLLRKVREVLGPAHT